MAHRLAVLFFMAAYTAAYAYGAPHTDTADELLRAWEIRHAIAFPAEGPFLGQAIHLGPAWFYVVALPLFVHASWLAAGLFVGFVCSLQFPLAYWCGRQLVDARFGLLWAVALFAPGWTSFQQLAFLNPNAVASAILAMLALALAALRRPSGAGTFAALGLAMAIALHVHPTSMPAWLLVLPLLARKRRSIGLVAALAAMMAGFALPFVPYLASQAVQGFPDRASAAAYVGGQVALANMVNAPAVLWHYVAWGPRIVAEYYLRWDAAAATALGYACAAAAAASLVAFAPRFVPIRAHAMRCVAAAIVFVVWVSLLRQTTPVQFTWALAPSFAALVAIALWCAWRIPVLGRPVVIAIALAIVGANLLTIRALALAVRVGDGHVPSSALDIKQPASRPVTDVWFPASGHAALGRLLCASRKGVAVHGHLANIVDKDLGLDTLFECGARDHVRLGGAAAGPHYGGMTRGFWRAWGAQPECWIGSMGIARVAGAPASPGLAIADGSKYLPRRGPTMPPTEMTLQVAAPAGSSVLVTNIVGRYELFDVLRAEANGTARTPVAANELSQLFVDSAAATWTLRVKTTYPDALDVIVVPGSGAGAGACDAT